MRFSPPLQVLERGPGGEVSESPAYMMSVLICAADAIYRVPTVRIFKN